MKALRVSEVAKRLGLSKETLWSYIRQGKLRKVKVSPRLVYIDPDSLKACFGDSIVRLRFPELYPEHQQASGQSEGESPAR